MKHLRKPVSLLLALIMVLSVFTIIPFATASAAEGDKVVFFTQNAQNPDWWGSNVYAYFYDSTDNNHVYSDAWPGTQLTQLTTNEYAQPVYSMIIPAAADNLIINNGTGWQLDNITGFADGYLYWINNGSGNAVGQTNTTTAEVPATCTVAGHEAGYAINGQNSTVNYFKLENGALVDGTIAATGHTWDTASPVWDTDPVNDNGTWKLGFVFNCTQGDGSTEKQWATCAAPEGTPASCTAAAQYSGTFTGTFDSESYSKELTWTVGDPAGHDYEEVWTWADDYTSAELTITCSVCGDTKSGSTTDVERIVVTEATYTTDGDGVYSAHVTIGGVEYVGSKAYTIPATGYPYYLALASNSYGFAKKYQFTDLNNGEYSIKGVYLTAGEQFKVRNTEHDDYWWPDGTDNDYTVVADGFYDVYFRPNGGGGQDWWYNVFFVAPSAATVTGYQIGLRDDIAFNFYANVTVDNYTAAYTCGALTADASITAVTPSAENNYSNVLFTCMIPARSMTDDVTLTVKTGDTPILTKTHRIVDYTATVAASTDEYNDLMCAMLNYGSAVQTYFGYKTDDLAAVYIERIDGTWIETIPGTLTGDTTDDAAIDDAIYGYRFAGATLSATSQTMIRLFFEKSSLGEETTITYNGTELTPFVYNYQGHEYYCINIKNIRPSSLFTKDYKFTFTNGGNSAELIYNAKNYYNKAMELNGTDDATVNFKNVMIALYNYSIAAAN